MAKGEVPQAVLAEQLGEKIHGRKVRAAVFTTFSFDPGFFELHVLPTLFDVPFNQVDKLRRIQLDDALQTVENIAVYYDRTALAQDALPAQLDFQRIGVRSPHGVFHPKLVLVLVENTADKNEKDGYAEKGGPESLIVGVLSANLTRSGWWENLETGHFVEVRDKSSNNETYAYRKDLLTLLRQVRELGGPKEEQAALVQIRDFLLKRASTDTPKNHSANKRHHTRLFFGQSNFSEWLDELQLASRDWNLEIISPYFDSGHAGTLEKLIEALKPKETRVYLPQNLDGSAGVSSDLYEAVRESANWSTLPQGLTRPGARAASQKATPRFVHAKVYRLWRRDKQVVIVGSVNLTAAAHSRVGAGNLEASFLVDVSDQNIPRRWWLQKMESDPVEYAETDQDETDQIEPVYVDVAIKFDWCSETLFYRVDGKTDGSLSIQEPSGRELFVIDQPKASGWIDCGNEAAESVKKLLKSTSFLKVVHSRGHWRVLVREEGMIHRPSLLKTLTPEEILLYWSLLSPAQREAFLGEKLGREMQLEGLSTRTHRYVAHNTLFDRFTGIYHAFERLYQFVIESIDDQQLRAAESRMFGAKYDSLPELLRKTLEANKDPVLRYIIFLCAKQIRNRVRSHDPDFWRMHRKDARELEKLLKHLPSLAAKLSIGDDSVEFLKWYETMFLRMISQPEEVV